MRIDFYTKAVLSVIAVSLLYIALGAPSIFPTARAQQDVTRVLVTGWVDSDGYVQHLPPAGGSRILALPVDTFRGRQ